MLTGKIFGHFYEKTAKNGKFELCEILKAFKIIKNKNAEMTGFSESVLLYTALFSQTAKK